MKIFITRDSEGGSEAEDLFLFAIDDKQKFELSDLVDEEHYRDSGKIVFTANNSKFDLTNIELVGLHNAVSKEDINNILPYSSIMELYPGPFEKIDEYCKYLCFMGLGSESCKDCPLAEAKKSITIEKTPVRKH